MDVVEIGPKNYEGPFIYGMPNTLELARRAGYPEYMLRPSKPIPMGWDAAVLTGVEPSGSFLGTLIGK